MTKSVGATRKGRESTKERGIVDDLEKEMMEEGIGKREERGLIKKDARGRYE